MQNMQNCCIRDCDSHKQTTDENIVYFKFPLHDIFLLKKWLRQIDGCDWNPTKMSRICSAHFKKEDMDQSLSLKHTVLLSTAVPKIFPVKTKVPRKRKVSEEEVIELKNEIDGAEPHRNKVSLLGRKSTTSVIGEKVKNEVEIKLENRKNEIKVVNNVGLVMSDNLNSQKTYLRIDINGKCNVPTSSKPVPFETVFLPYHEGNKVTRKMIITKKQDCSNRSEKYTSTNNNSTYGKSTISNHYKLLGKQIIGNRLKLKESRYPQTNITRYDLKSVSQDHMYSCPPKVKIQSNNSKTRQESDQLRRRLEELRQRRKREQLEIVRLQMHLIELEEKMKENNEEEIVLPNLGRGNKSTGVNNKSSWLIREKEEYEKLLKDVREIKLKVLRERHNRELEKIRRLQIQMTNLRKKMKENDEKEIALTDFKAINNSVTLRPDWMKREEEEYEKLLQDVRKIKQSYQPSKKNKQDFSKTDSIKCEKILSDEDCILIETMQEKNKLKKEVEDGNHAMRKFETGIDVINENDDYGEVIGEIDEDSIDVDMSKEVTILTFNEELPDPGLLDS